MQNPVWKAFFQPVVFFFQAEQLKKNIWVTGLAVCGNGADKRRLLVSQRQYCITAAANSFHYPEHLSNFSDQN
ncbi:MAG TPA: hypothetical protein VD996_05785, partial [Chitinophagaceae bacterium]|nr:hypothetical protein [Chitinophagaceae bacterium]